MCGALAIRLPCGVEQRAGEVEPLLDVDRVGGVLQLQAHLLGDRHEQVVEHLEHHRVDRGADGDARGARLDALEHEVIERRDRACQPGSTTVVALASAMIAGPPMRSPGASASRAAQRGVAASRRR